MALSQRLIQKFSDVFNGDNRSYATPDGPAKQGLVVRIGKVASLDTTNGVALCTIAGGTTQVPVGILNGKYPPTGSYVAVIVYGNSYLLLGTVDGNNANGPLLKASITTGTITGTVATLPLSLQFNYGGIALSSNTITVPISGAYKVTMQVQTQTLGDGSAVFLFVYTNGQTGSNWSLAGMGTLGVAESFPTFSFSGTVQLSAGNTLTVAANATSSVGINPDGRSSFVEVGLDN